MKNIKKYNFSNVYDLQNSSRTAFYKKILFPKATKDTWSSTETTLPEGTTKDDFDKESVLSRFDHQLKSSGINTTHTLSPDFSWSLSDISRIKDQAKLLKSKILTTEKDYLRIEKENRKGIDFIKIKFKIYNKKKLVKLLNI